MEKEVYPIYYHNSELDAQMRLLDASCKELRLWDAESYVGETAELTV